MAQPLLARAAAAGASTDAQACSSARAVHDRHCPNYTGFKTQAGDRVSSFESLNEENRLQANVSQGKTRAGQDAQTGVGRKIGQGVASWYGPRFQGRLTANGERFDMHALTAAHKTLPFGTQVLVRNDRTGKKVVVRINDRGPYVGGRVIDLSKAAARKLGMVERGHDHVVLHEAVA